MKSNFFRASILVLFTVCYGPAVADSTITLQTDIDAGAKLLTASQMDGLITNNTLVADDWYSYYPKGKKRLLHWNNKIFKAKWKLNEEDGFCTKTKKWVCYSMWQIGDGLFRLHERNSEKEVNYTVQVEQGNSRDLK